MNITSHFLARAHGDGIASVKGFLVFISNAKQGDHVKVKITNIDSVSAYAEITRRA